MTPPRVRFAPRRPATCTSAAPAPRCSTGSTPATSAAHLPAHRGHRQGAQHRGAHAGHLRRARLAGPQLGRGVVLPGRIAAAHRADAERLLARARPTAASAPARSSTRSAPAPRPRAARSGTTAAATGCRAEEIEDRIARGDAVHHPLPLPDDEIAWDDAVHGRISFQGRDLDDFVILRTDGTPSTTSPSCPTTSRWGSRTSCAATTTSRTRRSRSCSTARSGHAPPVFAHVPMILGTDGKKLTKRHGATAVGDYQHQGILPGRDAQLPRAARLVARRRPRDHDRGRR